MRKQQHIWQDEHNKAQALPGLTDSEPSSAVVFFSKFLSAHNITPPATVIDIGCGKGRNGIYLAEQGFKVHAMDYISSALDAARKPAKQRKLDERINFINAAIDEPWPFEDEFFDLKEIKKAARKLGRSYTSTNYFMIVQKP